MPKAQVTCSVEKGVMTIRIDNPELDNGLTWEGLNQFADCYEKLRAPTCSRPPVFARPD